MTTTTVDAAPRRPAPPRVAREPNETTRRAQETTTLSPRFYTTDVAAMNRLGIESVQAEWERLMAEFEADTNRGHFVQDGDWDFDADSLPEGLRKELVDFLVSSLTAEFSGAVLYAELHKKGFDPELKRLFKYMARDEGRHAGFINECLKEFGVEVDMGFLVKEKDYTFFEPKFILYATYLSEKIGYARYIRIFRHLEAHPEHRFHPIFDKFHRWCNDEFRHGEALALLMRGNPELLKGTNRLWIRFFQLAVFATMFVRDHTRPEFHAALGIDPEEYGIEVFRIVSEISKQVFPVLVDVENPAFLDGLRRLHDLAVRIDEAKRGGGVLGRLRALPLQARAAATFARLYLLPAKENTLPDDLRVAPAW
ncbi:MAG TPA: magnesium-protoporphyrin IX monomethyl ester (oxidative) cyclase [Sandaracinaceae bacterium LLY-WYZ-13_1]|nr:magnesium-protoporphyrin IX monomethyl ester (oxidative) cyclase [Sandaracinaceae bacterium LLY-WYZ-13_1]